MPARSSMPNRSRGSSGSASRSSSSIEAGLQQLVAHIAQRRKILDGETDGIEQRDLPRAVAAGALPAITCQSSVTG
jgi:hypothetical protein